MSSVRRCSSITFPKQIVIQIYVKQIFQLVPKTLPTEETDVGLLLKTPCAADAYSDRLKKKEQRFGNSGTLAQEVQTGFIYQRGLLPTPMAQVRDIPTQEQVQKRKEMYGGERRAMYLNHFAAMGMLPTPRVGGQESYETRAKRKGHEIAMSYLESNIDYQAKMGMLPTPSAGNEKSNGSLQEWGVSGNKMRGTTLGSSRLSTRFVGEMMGFPKGWTESPFLSGETKA